MHPPVLSRSIYSVIFGVLLTTITVAIPSLKEESSEHPLGQFTLLSDSTATPENDVDLYLNQVLEIFETTVNQNTKILSHEDLLMTNLQLHAEQEGISFQQR